MKQDLADSPERIARPNAGPTAPGVIESLVSAANGLVGDHLRARDNPLATPLGIYCDNARLSPTRAAVRAAYPGATSTLCVLVHGLGCHEGVWRFAGSGESYGSLLARDLGYTPVFVRYNSGLPVAENGDAFATELSGFVAAYPVPVHEIVCLGHSMGGLVLRSACHHALTRRLAWVERVTRMFYLGTPHEGADLERTVHAAGQVLRWVPGPITQLVADVLSCRSQGIQDLRHGDDIGRPGAQAHWLKHARHYLVNGTIMTDPGHPASILLGDGLVRHRHRRARRAEAPIEPHARTFPEVGHLTLAHHPDVYAQIRRWCEEA